MRSVQVDACVSRTPPLFELSTFSAIVSCPQSTDSFTFSDSYLLPFVSFKIAMYYLYIGLMFATVEVKLGLDECVSLMSKLYCSILM